MYLSSVNEIQQLSSLINNLWCVLWSVVWNLHTYIRNYEPCTTSIYNELILMNLNDIRRPLSISWFQEIYISQWRSIKKCRALIICFMTCIASVWIHYKWYHRLSGIQFLFRWMAKINVNMNFLSLNQKLLFVLIILSMNNLVMSKNLGTSKFKKQEHNGNINTLRNTRTFK